LILSCGIGAAWLPVAGDKPIVATLMIWAMLLTALAALFRSPQQDSLWASWPVGFYAGWLTAASCVSFGLCLVGYDVLKPDLAAMLVMGMAICISAAVQLSLARAPPYGLSVLWAFIGIAAANMNTSPNIAGLAFGGAVGLAALTMMAMLREQRYKRELAAA
jgi:small-conductance mechanosensitive channel